MSERSRTGLRLVAVTVFLALPIAMLGTAAVTALAWQETEALITRQEALIRQLELRLARTGADGRVQVDTRSIYLPATNRALAGAALQTQLTTAITGAAGKVVEVQALDDDPDTPTDAIALKLTFDVTNGGFLSILQGIETGLPLMTVETVAVRQLPSQDAAESDDPVLRVDLTVRAYFKAQA